MKVRDRQVGRFCRSMVIKDQVLNESHHLISKCIPYLNLFPVVEIFGIVQCWETALGQEVYRLIMTDLLLAVVGITVAETIRSQLKRRVWPSLTAPGFDINRNTLNLIHNQTLFWVGFFFSPLLPAVIVIKMYFTFHIKKVG